MDKTSTLKSTSPVGENKPRIDAREKVTGAALYADDIQFGNKLLHARIKRSPYPHALVKKIDVSRALALPGVKAVVTGQDFPGFIGLYLKDRHIFCRERVRYVGDPVAGVAAINPETAEKAVNLIDVEYEVLEPVFDPEFGASPQAPLLHPDLGRYTVASFILPRPGSNISNHFKIRKGDVSAAWQNCTKVIERKYRIPHIQHVPIEPHVAIAKVDESGEATLWDSSQSPFAQRDLIAETLGIPQSKMRVIAPLVGGGFGGKAGVSMESLAVAIASKVRGYPVKLLLTREEEFYTAFVRQGLVATFKMGCDADGKLQAMQNTFFWDGGAYTEYGVNITRAAGYSCTGPYEVPNVHTDSYCVYTNHPVGGPMRGFGMPEMHSGLEQCIDELALEIGMDAVEFRPRESCRGDRLGPEGSAECAQQTPRQGPGLDVESTGHAWECRFERLDRAGRRWHTDPGRWLPGYRPGRLHRGCPDGRRCVRRALRKRQGGHPGRHALQPIRMADGRQPHNLEHWQCHYFCGAGCPPAGSRPRGKSLERNHR
jgi:CO/xanthine dehydrogenase Mo-binding subunit